MKSLKNKEDLDGYLNNFLVSGKKNFTIERTNGQLKMVWDQEKGFGAYFRQKKDDFNQQLLWIYSIVKKSVNKYLESTGNKVDSLPYKYRGIYLNIPLLKSMEPGTQFYSIDLSHAYLRVAYLQGYISEKTYDKIIATEQSDEFINKKGVNMVKIHRNKALACLMSKKVIEHYVDGQYSHQEVIFNPKHVEIYTDIRNRCYKIFNDINELYPEKVIAYKTDCIYFFPEILDEIKSIFDEKQMLYSELILNEHYDRYYYTVHSSEKIEFKRY